MSDFKIQEVGGGGNPSPSKKKFKINKKVLLIAGGVVIVLFLLLRGRVTSQQAAGDGVEGVPVEYPGGTPENGVDVQAQLDQFAAIIEGGVNASLNEAIAEIRSEQNQLKADIGVKNKEYTDQQSEAIKKQLEQINKDKEALQVELDETKNALAPPKFLDAKQERAFRAANPNNPYTVEVDNRHIKRLEAKPKTQWTKADEADYKKLTARQGVK